MTPEGFINILIAEDQEFVRATLKLSLARLPRFIVIGEAADGATAVRKSLELAPHVVLMDIGMPIMDGIEATRLIKLRMPEIKVLVWSAHFQDNFVAAAVAAGADGYCVKSSPVRLLDQAIRSVFEGAIWFDPQVAAHVIRQMTAPHRTIPDKPLIATSIDQSPRIFGAAS